jgi:hypothetical protein
MTAGGTYRGSARVTTAAELDALPVGSVVLSHCTGERLRFDGLAWQKRASGAGEGPDYPAEWWAAYDSEWLPEPKMAAFLGGSFTVLFRPDAPQPATTDDAVERAARRVDNTKALLVELAVEEVISRGGITPEKVQEIRVAIGEVLG